MEYGILNELHREICHRIVEEAKANGPSTEEFDSMMEDIKSLEHMADKYLGLKMIDYEFKKY